MTSKLPIVMAATGQLNNLPGVRITGDGHIPQVPTEVGPNLEHIILIREHLAALVNSPKRFQQYELEAIANQLRVAGMPTATIFQDIAGVFHQNYARERRAEVKRVSESYEISRGYARGLGSNMDNLPDKQIHGIVYAAAAGELEKAVADVLVKTIRYIDALTEKRLQEIAGQSKGINGAYRSTNVLNSPNETNA